MVNINSKQKRWGLCAVVALLVLVAAVAVVLQTAWGQGLATRAGLYTRIWASYLPLGDGDIRFVRQIITADSATGRTIMWESLRPLSRPVAEYRLAGAKEAMTEPATETVLTDDGVTRYLYTAVLHDLTPQSTYEYRVGYDNKRGDWQSLMTAAAGTAATGPAGNFTALIFPDSQSADYRGWSALARGAYERHKDAAFFVNMGDLVDNGEDASQWDAWFSAVEPLAERIPFVGVMGNHETYDLQWQVRAPKAYVGLFALPTAVADDARRYYSFDYNDVHVAVLDTQIAERPEAERAAALAREVEWLRRDLASTTARWKIVLMHKDALRYPNTKQPDIMPGVTDMGRTFMPVFDEYGVDAVISAHYHTYRRRGHIKNFTRDERGPLYLISGVAGDVRYATLWKSHPLDTFVSPYPAEANYLVLTKTPDTLRLAAFLPDGTKFDEVELHK